MSETVALVVAAGRGSRMSGDTPKQYRQLAGRTVLRHTLETFVNYAGVARVCTVIHPDDAETYAAASEGLGLAPAIHGGAVRQDSVRLGLEAIGQIGMPDKVLIHDGARPFVPTRVIDLVIGALDAHAAVIPVLAVHDTLKRTNDNAVTETVDRTDLVRAQTPQGFGYASILDAHRRVEGQSLTDDAAVAEAAGLRVMTVAGAEENFKITRDEDLERASLWLNAGNETRVGTGFDVHRFEPGDSVRIGGIDIPHDQKLAGHSDADVALHALTDALLGALGDGDIGSHFPPSDPQWQNADSAQFLEHAHGILCKRGGRLIYADMTIICEAPRVGPHRDSMRTRIAEILSVAEQRISVKATTTEGLGFTGRSKGIAVQASVTINLEVR